MKVNIYSLNWILIILPITVGLVQLMLLSWYPMYWVSMLCLSICGVVCLGQCVFKSSSVNLWSVLASAIAMGYGVGALNTDVRYIRNEYDLLSITYAGQSLISEAMGLVSILFGVLIILGQLDSTRLFAPKKTMHLDSIEVLILSIIITVAAVIFVSVGIIGFHGNMTDGGVQIPVWATLVVMSIPSAVGLATYSASHASIWQRRILILCVIVLLGVQLYQSRREFMFTLVVSLVAYFSGNDFRRVFNVKGLLMVVLIAATLSGASKLVFTARIASFDVRSAAGKIKLEDLAIRTVEILRNSKNNNLNRELAENEASRTYIVGYLGELLGATETHEPLNGEVMKFGLSMVVPFVLWHDKIRYMLMGAEEAVAHPALGLPIWDAANSILTSGVSDFGWIGFFVYPILLVFLYNLVLRWAAKRDSLIYIFILTGLIYQLLSVENTIGSYLGCLRNLAIIVFMMWSCLRVARWIKKVGVK